MISLSLMMSIGAIGSLLSMDEISKHCKLAARPAQVKFEKAISELDIPKIRWMLEVDKINPNDMIQISRGLLFTLARPHDEIITRYLAETVFSREKPNLAAVTYCKGILDLLLKHGADVNLSIKGISAYEDIAGKLIRSRETKLLAHLLEQGLDPAPLGVNFQKEFEDFYGSFGTTHDITKSIEVVRKYKDKITEEIAQAAPEMLTDLTNVVTDYLFCTELTKKEKISHEIGRTIQVMPAAVTNLIAEYGLTSDKEIMKNQNEENDENN